MKFYFTYVLQSVRQKKLYIGQTANLKRRLQEHNLRQNLATKAFAPYQLIYFEGFIKRKDAINREKYLKSGWGLRSVKKLLKTHFEES